ncbi:methionine adenosyltransferase [Boudabousia liubingyangii]|uniref:Methionine adenosyltransferase n=1 Tax=Boudabousia liubingyangii TaxID=1921764 RepID=A0A1Q5PMS3_9ACTO|nr:methionine adenosyltransferase [Boudabousia liubingyangii]OKL48827.1 methionine adenosyltransferase [Boudabousia liubingyangii]
MTTTALTPYTPPAIRLETSESVCAGHPDKLCDRIADEILDACLWEDPNARCAVEVMASKHLITVAGQITCNGRVRIRQVVRSTLARLGYQPWKYLVSVNVTKQSSDIAGGVDRALEAREGGVEQAGAFSDLGAGDQGTVYGYATDATKDFLPASLVAAHEICARLDQAREQGTIAGIGPDGKAQVTLTVDEHGKPITAPTVVVSIQHDAAKDLEELRREVISKIVAPALETIGIETLKYTTVLVNPSGRFVKGGPGADTGLTGRKLMVDTYGGHAPHGGGAFSGKDATKVDRSGAYMARFLAKQVVAGHLAKRCTVSISYAIGKADPVAFDIDTHGTHIPEVTDEDIRLALTEFYSLRPGAIIDRFHLRRHGFARYSAYGHFGHVNGVYPGWEEKFDRWHLKEDVINHAKARHSETNPEEAQ